MLGHLRDLNNVHVLSMFIYNQVILCSWAITEESHYDAHVLLNCLVSAEEHQLLVQAGRDHRLFSLLHSQHATLMLTLSFLCPLSLVLLHLVLYTSKGGFPCGLDSKESAWNVGDPGSIPGMGRSPGEGNGNPLQYSCLENSMDRGVWGEVRQDWATTLTSNNPSLGISIQFSLWNPLHCILFDYLLLCFLHTSQSDIVVQIRNT